jgi:hypothetical protein
MVARWQVLGALAGETLSDDRANATSKDPDID